MGARNTPPRPSVSWDKARAGASVVKQSARICLDGDLLSEIDALNRELAQTKLDDAQLNRVPQAPGVAAEIVELTDLARAAEVEFVFKAIGRRAWRDLVAAHPPTPEQRKEGADMNPLTFPVAAMAACCVEPTDVDFDELGTLTNEGQWNKLWVACHEANTGRADVPFSVAAFALVRPTDSSSASRETTDSLAASS